MNKFRVYFFCNKLLKNKVIFKSHNINNIHYININK